MIPIHTLETGGIAEVGYGYFDESDQKLHWFDGDISLF
jgi:hypothetical protein